jgi:hypothetical protein
MANPVIGTARLPSQSNGYFPQATGQAISYMRNPDTFKVNRYVQLVESPGVMGSYYYIDRDTPARVPYDSDFDTWLDGSHRPENNLGQLAFSIAYFTLLRRNLSTTMGHMALEGMDKEINYKAHLEATLLQREMTLRTFRIISLLETVSNWNTTNTADANTLNGGAGNWVNASDDPSSANYNAILKSILAAQNVIWLQTNGSVKPEDLRLVISPGLAQKVSASSEIRNYVRNGPFSMEMIDSKERYVGDRWGLPKYLYGMELVVEDAVRVTDRPAVGSGILATASTNRAYVKSDTSAIITSRPGALDGNYGARSFSTVQCFWHKWLAAVFAFSDSKHELTEFHVTSLYLEVLASPESGFLITSCQ